MAATINNTLVKIQTVTVGSGGASSIDFTSIPQTYTDLVIVHSLRFNTSNINLKIEYNGSTSSYTRRQLVGDGSAASSYSGSDGFIGYVNASTYTANAFASGSIYIPNYTSSNYKSASGDTVSENNATTGIQSMTAHLWSNTAAITSIKLSDLSGAASFVQYSTATLYGVTATPNTTKASGGIIYQDATYMYHVFPYSGTFTPSTSLSCDVLVIAGGGGGGSRFGGGGGAGGLRNSTLSLSATGYSVTIGAGGAGGVTSGGAGTAGAGDGTSGSNSVFSTITSSGGGGGGAGDSRNGITGGSGGGGAGRFSSSGGTGNSGSYSPSEGNSGGGSNGSTPYRGGGGGGSGASGVLGQTSGNGGNGVTTYSSWAIATNTGQIVSGTGYYAAGGGGGGNKDEPTNGGIGGLGGGGNGGYPSDAISGVLNTGSGGGGGAYNISNVPNWPGGNGGSGLVIIRYAK